MAKYTPRVGDLVRLTAECWARLPDRPLPKDAVFRVVSVDLSEEPGRFYHPCARIAHPEEGTSWAHIENLVRVRKA